MIIQEFNIYRYNLPLIRPFFVKGKETKFREGFIIHLISDSMDEGFGETAPLNGYSEETHLDALVQLKTLQSKLIGCEIPFNASSLDGTLTKWLKKFSLPSSVTFGIESAVLNLLAAKKKIPLNQLLSNTYHDQIRVNGLLQGTKDELVTQAAKLLEEGFTAFKLKVDGINLNDDIEKVLAVSAVIEGRAVLHIDANQTWDLPQAVEFGRQVGLSTIDYVEEPLKDITQIDQFYHETLLPAALDESLQKVGFDQIKSMEGVYKLVLKPTCVGGIEKTWQFMELAKSAAIETVISSSFESSIGLLTLAYLSGCTNRDYHAGLHTLNWFKDDLLKNPLKINHGKLDISFKNDLAQNIDFSKLEKVI